MRRANFKSEEDLAKVVVEWLQGFHWEVYQEVQIHSQGSRADIVATQGPLVWVIETKLSFSLDVLGQADHWKRFANYVSIAVPRGRRDSIGFGPYFSQRLGIGVLRAHDEFSDKGVQEYVKPQFRRRVEGVNWHELLKPEHQTFKAAGTNGGGYWTPFNQTVQNIRRELSYDSNRGGLTIKELMKRVHHHYGSPDNARASMLRWIDSGVVKGVTLDKSKKPYMVKLCESAQSQSA